MKNDHISSYKVLDIVKALYHFSACVSVSKQMFSLGHCSRCVQRQHDYSWEADTGWQTRHHQLNELKHLHASLLQLPHFVQFYVIQTNMILHKHDVSYPFCKKAHQRLLNWVIHNKPEKNKVHSTIEKKLCTVIRLYRRSENLGQKKWYLQIGDLKTVQKLICLDQRSEHSNACCHDGMCLRQYKCLSVFVLPQTHAVTAAGLLTISIPTAYHGLRAVSQVRRLGLVDSKT